MDINTIKKLLAPCAISVIFIALITMTISLLIKHVNTPLALEPATPPAFVSSDPLTTPEIDSTLQSGQTPSVNTDNQPPAEQEGDTPEMPVNNRDPVLNVEEEILSIRAIWTKSREAIDAGLITATGTDDVRIRITDDHTKMVDISSGVNGIQSSRIYCFYNGELIFAFWNAGEQHRLYFKNEQLFRWRHTTASGDSFNYDNMFENIEYMQWEQRVYNDINDIGIR